MADEKYCTGAPVAGPPSVEFDHSASFAASLPCEGKALTDLWFPSLGIAPWCEVKPQAKQRFCYAS